MVPLSADPYLLRFYGLLRNALSRSHSVNPRLADCNERITFSIAKSHQGTRPPPFAMANHSLFLDWKFLYDCIFLFISWFFRAVCQLPGPLVQAPDDTVTSDAHLPNASVLALDWRLYVVIRFARTQHTFRDSQSHSAPDKRFAFLLLLSSIPVYLLMYFQLVSSNCGTA